MRNVYKYWNNRPYFYNDRKGVYLYFTCEWDYYGDCNYGDDTQYWNFGEEDLGRDQEAGLVFFNGDYEDKGGRVLAKTSDWEVDFNCTEL